MEDKLIMAASELPEPETSFGTLADKMETPKHPRPWKKTPVVLAAVLALLLCGMGWAKLQYSMWLIGGSNVYSDLEHIAGRYGIVLPESLGGTPFCLYKITGLVPQGAPWATALINPSYKPRLVTYGWMMEERSRGPDGESDGGRTRWLETDLQLNFGTTKNDLWRYFFAHDENGLWTGCEVPESYYTIEYKGLTLQIGDTTSYNALEDRTVCTRWVHWVDEEKQVAFSISESDYSDPDRVVECAKAIIDLNS